MHVKLHPELEDNPQAQHAAALASACVHCGFCLETCPTYLDARDERDSPRGRIYLVAQLLESASAGSATRTHLDRCLTCRGCETTCPSGVEYGQILDIGRALVEDAAHRPADSRAARWPATGCCNPRCAVRSYCARYYPRSCAARCLRARAAARGRGNSTAAEC